MMRCFIPTLVFTLPSVIGFAAEPDLFRDQVAPILEARCVRCHQGEDAKGGLALTSASLALTGGEGGPSIVPGQPEESFLLDYVSGQEPEMPREDKPLSAAEVEVLRKWIEAGARWPTELVLTDKRVIDANWWSLKALAEVAPPHVDSAWVRNPIDAFILQKLQQSGMSPSGQADRRTLIRRLSFDLHGLPPTPEQIDAFVTDSSPDAYEKLVDELLASPRYGERWARHWLDVVHFGESHGYDKDKPRPNAWPYRDYVINAFNSDKPYSRFVQEQLAGDVLFPNDPQATVATGFIAAGPWDFVGHVELREGTVDKLIARSNDRDDMVAATMSTFTSLTVHCARCHNHKFDPIKQQEYYSLQAIFAGVERADRPYDPDTDVANERVRLLAQQDQLQSELQRIRDSISQISGPELTSVDSAIAQMNVRMSEARKNAVPSPSLGYHSEIMPSQDVAKWVQIDLGQTQRVDKIKLVPAHVVYGGHSGPGFGFPHRFKVELSTTEDFQSPHLIADYTAADFPAPGDIPLSIDAGGFEARYVRVTATKLWERTNDWIFALAELQCFTSSSELIPAIAVTAIDSIEASPSWAKANLVDGFSSTEQLSLEFDRLQSDRSVLISQRENLLQSLIPSATRDRQQEIEFSLTSIAASLSALPEKNLVYAATPSTLREIHLLERGDVRSPKILVQPAALESVEGVPALVVADLENEGARRAALAGWLTDPNNALVRRSIVNRVWHYHFGQGLVDTPNDFGRMGSEPTHPELLDWLAGWFLENGESLKQLHRLIVTSNTYQQSSADKSEFAKIDASNRLLWRMNRLRLDAESLRDSMLAITGRLDFAMGGPSVQQFYFKDDHSPVYDYEQFDVDDPRSNRRSIYRFLVRSVPDPLMDCLDCADPSILTPKRNTTMTALQALAMYNNKFAVRQSQHLAQRVAELADDPSKQVHTVYRLALGRAPTESETAILVKYIADHGLTNACRVLLNSNEFMFID